ncbi:MAG TPA: TAT-variant-translocated molybdopterin oxidoreductase [Candidatus Polarisedimenticolaceae bacterium]|nr:TAT-variant-translocated molybdopterin oxidoreductase [Candidatus Polarisedimenticolaceae bacterium]
MPPLDDDQGRMWRSLEDLAGDPSFRETVGREFPLHADEMLAPSRRDFLRLMGASVALAGMTACRRWPTEHIVPFAHRPEGYVPGSVLQFATAFDLSGRAIGLLVSSYDGRPIKIEGNPLHPGSLGATDTFAQATILELYDPDRSTDVIERTGGAAHSRTQDDFDQWLDALAQEMTPSGGQGFRILAEPSSSPTLADLQAKLALKFPKAVWVEWDPLTGDQAREGASLAFGRPVRTVLDLAKADVIAAFDADLFVDDPQSIENARAWAVRRSASGGTMNRMWVVEAGFTNTGACADERIAVQSALVSVALGRLAARLRAHGLPLPPEIDDATSRFVSHPWDDKRIDALAQDLLAARGRGAVVVGKRQPAAAHALAHALNAALGNAGAAVRYAPDPAPARPSHSAAAAKLAGEIGAGLVEALLIVGGNPAYDAPGDLDFATKIASVKKSAHLALYDDETSRACRWHVPQAHYLEAWGDARAWDGTVSVVQPLIEPLYGGRSAIELVARFADGKATAGYDLVRRRFAGSDPEWRRIVHDGVAPGTRSADVSPAIAAGFGRAVASLADARQIGGGAAELVFTRSAFYDGRFANLGWLAELPDPVTKLTWDNAALLAPADADALGVKRNGDLVAITAAGGTITLPAYILPGQPVGTVGVALGWGRTAAGRVGNGLGVDAYRFRRSDALWRHEAKVTRASGHIELATTQDHHVVDALGKKEQAIRADELIRTGTLKEYKAHPEFAKEMVEVPKPANLWKPHEYSGHKWAMAIDLSSCVGCAACTIACQAENNIPVVGKSEVLRGREMHWIRVDRYFAGEAEKPRMAFQPMACHHCENAPCEQVCPVAATVHDHEGLNVMIYNRCVGTRYCSNNCPYKVRRFNWFNNHKHESAVAMMVYNPDVTVRSRGVMEKCTYCIQRIETAKIAAKNERRDLQDGEIVPACAQVCPTEAIVFGDLNLKGSRIAARHADARSYGVLDEVNTGPRTRYLARLKNPAGEEA